MDERRNNKAKTEIVLQARFNEKSKRSKEKGSSKRKTNLQNFGGKDSQILKASIWQRGESSSKGSFQRNHTKKFDKSNVKCYNCYRLGHFAKECNTKSRENKSDKAKVARQEVDDDNMLLLMITEENYGKKKLLDSSYKLQTAAAATREMLQKCVWSKT